MGMFFLQSRRHYVDAFLLLLAAATVLIHANTRLTLRHIFSRDNSVDWRWLTWPFPFFFLTQVISAAYSPADFALSPGRDYVSLRYCLAPAMLALTWMMRPSPRWLLSGLVLAAIAAATHSAIDVFFMEKARAQGWVGSAVPFGHWSMLIAMLMVLFSALATHWRTRYRLALLVFAALAAFACLLSISRSSLLTLPVLGALLLFLHKDRFHRLLLGIGTASILLGGALVLTQSELREQLRITEAMQDLRDTQRQEYSTSIGARFVMWGAAWNMFKEHPWTGVGPKDFQSTIINKMQQGEIPPFPTEWAIHAHSDVLHSLASSGLPGFLGYLAVIIGPGVFFTLALGRADFNAHQRLYAAAGILVTGWFFCAGLTEALAFYPKRADSGTYPLLIFAIASQLLTKVNAGTQTR